MIPIIGALIGIGESIVNGVKQGFESKRRIREAITENKIALAKSTQSHNQDWELKQLDNAGWKDDVLFYSFILCFVWAGFDPEGAKEFFANLQVLPDWFLKTWFWLLASVLGVKKIGEYAPGMIKGVKEAFKSESVKREDV